MTWGPMWPADQHRNGRGRVASPTRATTIGAASTTVPGVSINRRNPNTPIDTQLGVIRVDDLVAWSQPATLLAKGKKIGVKSGTTGEQFAETQLRDASVLRFERIDAATLIHSQAYQAERSGDFRLIANTTEDLHELFAIDTVSI